MFLWAKKNLNINDKLVVTFETLLPHGKQTLAPTFSHISKQYYVPAKVLEFHPYTPEAMGQSDKQMSLPASPPPGDDAVWCKEQWTLEATNLESNPFANVESWASCLLSLWASAVLIYKMRKIKPAFRVVVEVAHTKFQAELQDRER